MVLAGAFFFWSTVSRSGWSSRSCRLCAGAACQSWRLLEEFPLQRCLLCRAVRTWKSGHFSFALVSFSLFWCMGVACGVQRIGYFGRSCVHCTWFDSGYMFFERLWKNLHIFHVAVNSNPEAFGLHSCIMEKRAQSMLLVVASLSAVRTLEVEHYFYERSIFDSCGNFRCVVQHFSSPR